MSQGSALCCWCSHCDCITCTDLKPHMPRSELTCAVCWRCFVAGIDESGECIALTGVATPDRVLQIINVSAGQCGLLLR
jgi:hypothetical protein